MQGRIVLIYSLFLFRFSHVADLFGFFTSFHRGQNQCAEKSDLQKNDHDREHSPENGV